MTDAAPNFDHVDFDEMFAALCSEVGFCLHDKGQKKVIAALLIENGAAAGVFDDILVDQGDADPFLAEQLKPELLAAAAKAAGQRLTLRMQPGYDHSYFFMASFVDDHVAFHATRLKA